MIGTGKRYIAVVLPLKLGWTPYYEVLPEDNVSRGDWVRTVFANREYTGIVYRTDVTPDAAPEKIKPILSVERHLSPVSGNEIRLWEMVADYYLCTIGEVFKAAYPSMKISEEQALARARERENARRQKLLATLGLRMHRLEERLEKKKEKLSSATGKSSSRKDSARLQDDIVRMEQMISETRLKIDEVTSGAGLQPACGTSGTVRDCIVLNEAQRNAFTEITGTFRDGKPALLKGITGSGKTEIYLELARETVMAGRNVLYLVPEIAMSRQLGDRVRNMFGDLLLTFHSGESTAARRDTAEAVRSCVAGGRTYIVLGTRSAIFLPHNNLGLIIVDEEHDSSYKQESPAPRYNGRDAAVMLARIHGCNIILGSATPSLESVFNCRCGKYRMSVLDRRYYAAEDAEVRIIDTAAERRKGGMTGSFSRKLTAQMEQTLANGEQILIFRARRAFSPVLQCPGCGEIIKCPHCNVSLSYHRAPDRMTCHHCGYSAPFTPECPECGTRLQGLGSGTQKIEEETALLFPEARIARLDSDTPKAQARQIISDFSSGKTDILIGTQIISKGFDFPGLTLAAVISADSLLGVQDFRADEKALQILEQIRGRCGRRDRRGCFIIQTYQPEHPVYRHLSEGSSETLYSALLDERRQFGYPPFTRIVNITVKSGVEEKAESSARTVAETLEECLGHPGSENGHETVSSPFSPPIDKIAGLYIRTIRVTLRKDRQLTASKRLLAAKVDELDRKLRHFCQITADVDPE